MLLTFFFDCVACTSLACVVQICQYFKYRDHLELIGCNEHDIDIFNGL